MKRPIFLKIFSGFLVVTILLASLILLAFYNVIQTHYLRFTEQKLERIGIPLRQVIAPLLLGKDAASLNSMARDYGPRLDLRITVIDPSGTVLADSERDPATLENHLQRPEVKGALEAAASSAIRYSKTLDEDLLYVALPVEDRGRIIGVLRLSMSLKHISDLNKALLVRLVVLSAVIILVSLVLAAIFSHLLATPIRALSKAASRIAGGDFSARVSPSTTDEIQDLSNGFNTMAGKLEQSFSELSSRKEELEGILASITGPLFVLDAQGRVTLSNAAARRVIATETASGRYYWELIRSARLNELMGEATKGTASGEVEFAGLTYLCSITPLASRQGNVMLLHDITQMKELERIKQDLAVNVSHELRTPLTAIKGFTETLMEEASEGQAEYLRIILRHTERLIAMVNDLLVLSEMEETARIDRERVDLQDILSSVLVVYEPRIRAKGIDLVVDCPHLEISADAFRLEQLLTNLVDNALKYTDKGAIRIRAGITGGMVTIEVQDTGPGIPREHLSRIFERFYVADKSRSRSMGGTGLGLSIAKHIATLHGGRIEVMSTPYQGTTFSVILPVGP